MFCKKFVSTKFSIIYEHEVSFFESDDKSGLSVLTWRRLVLPTYTVWVEVTAGGVDVTVCVLVVVLVNVLVTGGGVEVL
jgi:hypothetical protein